MIEWATRRIHLVCSAGGFGTRAEVMGYSLRVTLSVVLVADILNIVAHISLHALGLLPYPVLPATTVGVIITTVLAGSLAFCVSYVTGLAIHQLSISRAAFEHLSRTDMLSGLLNRRAFLEAFAVAPEATSFALFDIDRFKAINDRYGHDAGDRVIVAVAEVLTACFGSAHVTARIGGEEFAVLISGLTATERLALCEVARREIGARAILLEDQAIGVTVSGGVAERRDHSTFGPLFAAADKALYVAKASGRDLVLHDRDIPAEVRRRRDADGATAPAGSLAG